MNIQRVGIARLFQLLQRIFRHQARSVAAMLNLDGEAPDLTPWIATTAAAVKPLLVQLAQAGILQRRQRRQRQRESLPLRQYAVSPAVAFKSARARIDFDLFNPKVLDAIDEAAFAFCRATTQTAQESLSEALVKLRAELKAGLAHGEGVRRLAARVQQIFASPSRAFTIAATESSRAVNMGQFLSAKDAGIKYKSWLASSDACERCLTIQENGSIPLDQPFYVDPAGGPYAVVMYPPLHPHCFCVWEEEMFEDLRRMARSV